MNERKLSLEKEQALIRLLDDPTPQVREGLLEEFRRLGSIGQVLLKHASRSSDVSQVEAAEWFLRELEPKDIGHEFLQFIRSQQYELETGTFLLCRSVYGELAFSQIEAPLTAITRRCQEMVLPGMGPWEICKVMNRVIFHEYGFRTHREDFDDPRNSFLNDVLVLRRGLPVTLCVIYILVGRRLKLDLEPIGLPGRFMAGLFSHSANLYIDSMERGRFRTQEELEDLLIEMQVMPHPSYFLPVSTAEVLARMCRNLVRQFTIKDNPRMARQFAQYVREFEKQHRKA